MRLKDTDEEEWSVETCALRDLRLMQLRCEEQGCSYENCCTFAFQVYQRCRWCGETR